VRVEAGEIGLDELLRDNRGVGLRHAGGHKCVAGKRDHRRDRVALVLGHGSYAAAARAWTGKYFSSQS